MINSSRFFLKKRWRLALVILPLVWLSGCRTFPSVELGQCEEFAETDRFCSAFDFGIENHIHYRYFFHRRGIAFVCNGIVQKEADVLYIAGFSDAGITLFSAHWTDDSVRILTNNMQMPDAFLKNSILTDFSLLFRTPATRDCAYYTSDSDSVWLEMANDLAGHTGYFVINEDGPAWIGLSRGRLYYRARAIRTKEGALESIEIDNLKHAYRSTLRVLNIPGGQG